ncbi:MAG: hypothetical protein V5A22_07235 [Salinivenus sp.]
MTVLAAALVLVGTLGVGLAATPNPTSGDIPLQTDSGLVATVTSDLPSVPFADSETVELRSLRVSSPGTSSLTVAAFDDKGFSNVTQVDATSNPITVNRTTASNETVLKDDITSASVTDVTPVKSGDTDLVYSAAADSRVLIDSNGNGVVAVDRATGNALDEASPALNGTATVTLPKGSTQRIDFQQGPDTLLVRDVSNPQTTITNVGTVEVRFYERGGDSVFVRESNNGRISFAGLPKTSSFVARPNITGYFNRPVLIDSVFSQSELYALNNSADTVNASFTITDNTGQFGGETEIQLSRALNTSGSADDELQYVAVAGEVLGSAQEFTTTLEANTRYRVSITSADGQQRQLGSVTPSRDRVYDLEVSGLGFPIDDNSTVATINATGNKTGSGANTQKTLTVVYNDAQDETTDLSATIYERGNESNVLTTIDPSRSNFPLGTFKFSTTLTGAEANTSWVVEYEYKRLGEIQAGTEAFGAGDFAVQPLGLGDGWQSIFSVGMLMILAGLFSVGNARIGALIIPGAAFALYQLGWLTGTTSVLGIALAFSVAVAYNLVQTSGGVLQ